MSTAAGGPDLRNRRLRGHNLRGVDLRGADLRGTDFTAADLRGADLRAARLGVSRAWKLALAAFTITMSIAIGLAAGVAGNWIASMIRSSQARDRALGVFLTIELALFLVAAVWKGIDFAALRVLPAAIGIAAVIAVAAVLSGLGPGTGVLTVIAFSSLLLGVVVFTTFARAVASSVSMVMMICVFVAGMIAGRLTHGGLYATAIAIAGMFTARRALAQKHSQRLTRASMAVTCAHGTCFRDADLRGANFASAQIDHTDFRGAELDAAHFESARIGACLLDPSQNMKDALDRRQA